MTKRPNSMRHLDDTIRKVCGGSVDRYIETRTIMANAVVAQMLPDGVVKGGSAIRMRLGATASRFTTDLDTATATNQKSYIERLAAALESGWEGFTGRIIPREPAHPDGVPQDYIMAPYDVRLSYNGKPWCTVPLEVGHNEIGDADTIDWVESNDIGCIFQAVGLPSPGKLPLMPLPHQIAQKLHALSSGGDRARDLVDLQLIMGSAPVDLQEAHRTCKRLFSYRKAQPWPPVIEKQPGWDTLYATQASGLPVKESVDEAVAWVNELIVQIDQAG